MQEADDVFAEFLGVDVPHLMKSLASSHAVTTAEEALTVLRKMWKQAEKEEQKLADDALASQQQFPATCVFCKKATANEIIDNLPVCQACATVLLDEDV